MKIIIATNNTTKQSEIKTILQAESMLAWEFHDTAGLSEPEEPFLSFIENACHKAKYYAQQLQMPALSDDTGICVTALDQFPGVQTKDFISASGSIDNAFQVIQEKLAHTTDMSATYVCAVAMYIPEFDVLLSYEARELGRLCFPPRGVRRCGFDSVFVPQGYENTLAELGVEFKNRHSHRALAIKGLLNEVGRYCCFPSPWPSPAIKIIS
jgi:XTP/dITP diphosphohydrolase